MKKLLSLGMAAVLTATTLAGCGGGKAAETTAAGTQAGAQAGSEQAATQTGDGQTGTQDGTQTSGGGAGDGTVTEITWWAFPTFAQNDGAPAGTYEQELIAAFEAKNPDVKVILETIDFTSGPEKITAAIEAGTICDVLFDAPGRIISYGKAGKLVELNDMFTEELVKDIDNDALLSACRTDDTYYMYPLSTAAFCMAFNKACLEESGAMELINLEGDRTWTTDTFEEVLNKLHEAGFRGATVYCSGQGGDQGIRAFVTNLYSSQVTNPELTAYTINDEGGVQAMTKIKEWVDAGLMENGSAYNGGEDIDQFAMGNTAFTTLWGPGLAATNGEKLENGGVEAVALPFPSEDGVPALEYLVNGFCVFDNGDAARAEASKRFIDFICNDEEWGKKNVVQTSVFPVRSSYGNLYGGDEEKAFFASLNQYFSPYYNTIDGFAEMRTYWFPMLQAVLNGEAEPKAALDDFVAKSNQSIQNAQ